MTRAAGVELQPIDRLEEKVRHLVGLIDSLRDERAKAQDEAARLGRELEAARSRIAQSEGAAAELAAMRDEREMMKNRVVQMIAQIDKLSV